ncbi:MAG: ParB/RepB/Spo0J family partition protein [Oligoflexales bacterium]
MSSKSRKQKMEATHKSLQKGLDREATEYFKTEERAERFKTVKGFFENQVRSQRIASPGIEIKEIDLSQNDRVIDTNDKEFLALKESIEEVGLLQRPVLTLGTNIDKPFLCVAGHRRITALIALGKEKTPAELVFSEDEKKIRIARLSENLVRSDLKPLEFCSAVAKLKKELSETNTGLARIINKNRGYIVAIVKINSWPVEAREIAERNNFPISQLTGISKLDLNNQEILERLRELELKKVGGIVSTDSTPKSKNTSDDNKRNGANRLSESNKRKIDTYFMDRNIDEPAKAEIINFLKEMKIRGWCPDTNI